MELAGLAGGLVFGLVMGGPDSNRDLCKIGNWACRILFMPLGNIDTRCVENIFFC
jgi:hypothetical protein